MDEAAKMALDQINAKQYTETLKIRGIKEALKIGIGFYGKVFEMQALREKLYQ